MNRETITCSGITYASKKPGESFRAYACAFCKRLDSWATVQTKNGPKSIFIGINCKACGHAFPRRACPLFQKRNKPKRMGWHK